MKRAWALLLVCGMLLEFPALAAEGMFEGKVVSPPVSERSIPGWIYVQGRNHMLRRVEVAHAVVVFGKEVPASERRPCRMDCIEVGQEVRVIAEQDKSGEWRAKRVEILQLMTRRA
jgi:hypothetical protein